MIGDLVDRELKKNAEYIKLGKEIEQEEVKIERLSEEYQMAHKKNKRLHLFALISQIIVLICCLINISSITYFIIVTVASRYANKINNKIEQDYYLQINKASNKSLKAIKLSKEIIYKTYDEIEEKLQTIKKEAEHHLKDKNYDEILKNAKKYENVLPLIENSGYYQILLYLIRCSNIGINSMTEIPAEEKQILEIADYEAKQIEKTQKQNPLKHKTLGEVQREFDEKMEEMIKNDIISFMQKQKKKEKTIKKK